MAKSRGVVYTCDGCGDIAAVNNGELPRGFHGGPVHIVGDGWGGREPEWWACGTTCLDKIVKSWTEGPHE